MVNYYKANHSDSAVGLKSSQILPRNPNRTNVVIINDSDQTIYISIGIAARLNAGIRLNCNGGSYSMNEIEKNLTDQSIFAICGTANKKILVTEYFA